MRFVLLALLMVSGCREPHEASPAPSPTPESFPCGGIRCVSGKEACIASVQGPAPLPGGSVQTEFACVSLPADCASARPCDCYKNAAACSSKDGAVHVDLPRPVPQ